MLFLIFEIYAFLMDLNSFPFFSVPEHWHPSRKRTIQNAFADIYDTALFQMQTFHLDYKPSVYKKTHNTPLTIFQFPVVSAALP
jgi:hypothetical protein